VDQFTLEEVQNRNKKLAGRKAKPSNEIRFKVDRRKFQIRDKRFYPMR
jgi:hypothetical protein